MLLKHTRINRKLDRSNRNVMLTKSSISKSKIFYIIVVLFATTAWGLSSAKSQQTENNPIEVVNEISVKISDNINQSADEITDELDKLFSQFDQLEPWKDEYIGSIISNVVDSVKILADSLKKSNSLFGTDEYVEMKTRLKTACIHSAAVMVYLVNNREKILDSFQETLLGPSDTQIRIIQKLEQSAENRIERQVSRYNEAIRSASDTIESEIAERRLEAFQNLAKRERGLFTLINEIVDSARTEMGSLRSELDLILFEAEMAAPLFAEAARVIQVSEKIESILAQLTNAKHHQVAKHLEQSIKSLRGALDDYQVRLRNEYLPTLKVTKSEPVG